MVNETFDLRGEAPQSRERYEDKVEAAENVQRSESSLFKLGLKHSFIICHYHINLNAKLLVPSLYLKR